MAPYRSVRCGAVLFPHLFFKVLPQRTEQALLTPLTENFRSMEAGTARLVQNAECITEISYKKALEFFPRLMV